MKEAVRDISGQFFFVGNVVFSGIVSCFRWSYQNFPNDRRLDVLIPFIAKTEHVRYPIMVQKTLIQHAHARGADKGNRHYSLLSDFQVLNCAARQLQEPARRNRVLGLRIAQGNLRHLSARAFGAFTPLVRMNDGLHQLMAHDVLAREK